MQLPMVTIPALIQGFGQGRGDGCWDAMWMKKMGGASEVHAQCEAAGGGKGGAKREEGWGCCYSESKCFCATHPSSGPQVKACIYALNL